MKRSTKMKPNTLWSDRTSLLKRGLTEPTLLESSGWIFGSLCHQPLHVFDEQIARWTPQTFFGDRTCIRELYVCPRSGIELGPRRQLTAVRITRLGKIGPVLLHGI